MSRSSFYLICFIVMTFLLVLGYGAYYLFTKQGPMLSDTTIILERGSSGYAISRKLEESGIIHSALVFRLGLKFFSERGLLKAGEYKVQKYASSKALINLFQSGKTLLHSITVAEGLTSYEVMNLLKNNEKLSGSLSVVPEEGSLLPETYYFSRGQSRISLIDRMQKSMKKLKYRVWRKRPHGLPLHSIDEVIILASIVEKETGKADERARVAGVFINRLRLKMRLQSDPTVIYGITHGRSRLGRSLSRADLRHSTPFNTYRIDRLPPHPIANPGFKSIMAVINPEKSKDLYFVA